jgi:hypothetical protein
MESPHDYKALTASDGVFGLAIARVELPDLIIMKVIMPFEGGFYTADPPQGCLFDRWKAAKDGMGRVL